ncbi:hypothetical protein BCR33DRAFT_724751, partial [Rhizoclosmatium globosum]
MDTTKIPEALHPVFYCIDLAWEISVLLAASPFILAKRGILTITRPFRRTRKLPPPSTPQLFPSQQSSKYLLKKQSLCFGKPLSDRHKVPAFPLKHPTTMPSTSKPQRQRQKKKQLPFRHFFKAVDTIWLISVETSANLVFWSYKIIVWMIFGGKLKIFYDVEAEAMARNEEEQKLLRETGSIKILEPSKKGIRSEHKARLSTERGTEEKNPKCGRNVSKLASPKLELAYGNLLILTLLMQIIYSFC